VNSPEGTSAVSRTILAVDDSTSMRQMVAYVLKQAGYQVVEAEDGEEALTLASRQRFDAIITDHNMPRMDGLTLVRTLRATDGYASTPIMLLTTESSAELKQKGRDAGATGWMVKPFDPDRLLDMCRRILA
jgi:two-component system, chemotaxis family, chemotaxis protein CheY